MEVPTLEPGVLSPDAILPPPETFFQKVLRFFRGLIGLDSAAPQLELPGEFIPDETQPIYGPGGKGG
jgi:hypothetical protein